MELFYFLGNFWNFVYIVLFFVLFKRIRVLNERVDSLSNKNNINKQSSAVVSPEIKSNSPLAEYVSAAKPEFQQKSIPVPMSPTEESQSDLSDWFRENTILKIGIMMILLGFGWFVSYAFIHNWIGPVGRITIGVVLGSLITIFGTIRLSKNRVQGNAFTILGTALVIITVLAGEYYYSFFSPLVVLLIVFLVSLYVVLSSVIYSDEKLAFYGVLVSLLAPYISHTTGMDNIVLFLYLSAISISTIWVSIAKNWKSIILTGLTGVLMYSTSNVFAASFYQIEMKYLLLFIAYGISLIYMFTEMWIIIKNKFDTSGSELYISVINSILILGFTNKIVPKVFQSLTLSFWMIVFAVTGFLVFIKTRNQKLFYIHSCISIFFLAVATSIELSGPTLVIAFAIESAIIAITGYLVTNDIKISEYLSATISLPAILSLSSIASNKWNQGIMHSDFVVLAVMGLILAILAVFYRLNVNENDTSQDIKLYQFYLIVSSFYALVLVWLCSHALISDNDTAVFISLLVYTVTGLGTYFSGVFNKKNFLKKYGTTLLVLVVLRLLIVDVWRMELSLRIVTFIVLGVLFISTAFISKNRDVEHKLNS